MIMLFIIEEVKEIISGFSQGTLKVLGVCVLQCYFLFNLVLI